MLQYAGKYADQAVNDRKAVSPTEAMEQADPSTFSGRGIRRLEGELSCTLPI